MPLTKLIPRFAPFALLGAVVATLCDVNHVLTGTLSYPEPFFMGQAIFVFPGFFVAFTVMMLSYHYIAPLFPKAFTKEISYSSGNTAAFIESLLFFMAIYLMSGFGNTYPALLSGIFYGFFVLRWAFSYEKSFLLLFAIVLGFNGMFVEGLMTKFDLVHYSNPEVFGVPYWLGGVYMHGAIALREGMRLFVYR